MHTIFRSRLFIILLMTLPAACHSQRDSASLLQEAGKDLEKAGSQVSTVLVNPKYRSLHPLTSFRELIARHATKDILRIAEESEPGRKIRVNVTVQSEAGQPLSNAKVYLYQTDARGWYAADRPHVGGNEGDTRHARLFGYVITNEQGMFELHTVKPSGYPQSDLPAHIHVHVDADGYRTLVTELLFDDDERLKGEIRERALREGYQAARPGVARAPFDQQFDYTLRLPAK